jgi:hypothetical protein
METLLYPFRIQFERDQQQVTPFEGEMGKMTERWENNQAGIFLPLSLIPSPFPQTGFAGPCP